MRKHLYGRSGKTRSGRLKLKARLDYLFGCFSLLVRMNNQL
jgi:hypothetical protein